MWKRFKALKWWGKLAVVAVLWLALGGILHDARPG